MSQNIAIVGSGFLGMILALRLGKSGAKVTLFESAGEIGGLSSVCKIGDVTWNERYEVRFLSNTHTQNLVEELGLSNECRWVETRNLGLAYKEPLAAFVWTTIQRIYGGRNSGPKKEMFGYVRGGYARILERFGEVLAHEGVEIRLNSPVHTVERIGNAKLKVTLRQARRRTDPKPPQRTKYARVNTTFAVMPGFSGGFLAEPELKPNGVFDFPRNGLADTFDIVILTCPSDVAAKIAPQLSRTETQDLENAGIIRASNYSHDLPSMKTSVDGLYIVNSSLIVSGTLDLNETVRLAEKFLEHNFTPRKHSGQTE